VNYLNDISDNCSGDVIFVSNSETIPDSEIDKISGCCSKIIIRKNIGYDFAAYFSGFVNAENKEKYKNIIFLNDSVYGPFYSLKTVFDKMENVNADAWCITDNLFPTPHMQSYFIVFKNSTLQFLENYYKDFEYLNDKEEIIKKYEIGFCNEFKKAGFHFTALCKHEEMIGFEKTTQDEVLKEIKRSIQENLFYKPSFRSLYSKSYNRELNHRKFLDVYGSPHLNMWYTTVKYFNNPFIKTNLIRNPKLLHKHNFIYKILLKELYPEHKISF
jgi:lipopolysaccharide biosynthesis protein